jgi:hypothetical protein
MLTFDSIKESLSGLTGVDVTLISAFVEKIKEARTSAFYNDELQREYRNLDVNGLYSILRTNNRFAVRKQVIANKIRNTPHTFVSKVDYF